MLALSILLISLQLRISTTIPQKCVENWASFEGFVSWAPGCLQLTVEVIICFYLLFHLLLMHTLILLACWLEQFPMQESWISWNSFVLQNFPKTCTSKFLSQRVARENEPKLLQYTFLHSILWCIYIVFFFRRGEKTKGWGNSIKYFFSIYS